VAAKQTDEGYVADRRRIGKKDDVPTNEKRISLQIGTFFLK
jgi:hypothetical protein